MITGSRVWTVSERILHLRYNRWVSLAGILVWFSSFWWCACGVEWMKESVALKMLWVIIKWCVGFFFFFFAFFRGVCCIVGVHFGLCFKAAVPLYYRVLLRRRVWLKYYNISILKPLSALSAVTRADSLCHSGTQLCVQDCICGSVWPSALHVPLLFSHFMSLCQHHLPELPDFPLH